ncbi:MAG TPA: DUF1707 domain-containing protein [Streptosporangiaceae bacterium]|nr:DUF1707 domain-containing protein [Streptosporangiaceae bacterium]
MFDDRIRTSDADREQVAARLRDHFAEGRLNQEEFDERLTAALSAKTFGDLRQVLTDLPGPKVAAYQPQRPQAARSAGYRPPVMFRRGPRLFPLLVLALLAIVLFSGAGAAVLALKVVAIITLVMFLAFAAVAVAGAMFFRRVRKHWMAQFDNDAFSSWAERFGGPGQFKFQSWEWPPRHRHHHHRGRSRESGYWQS